MGVLSDSTKEEFSRVNAYIDINFKMIQMLLEDSMINHLLLEQDIIDRK
jgi:hypothetical protein